MITLTKFQMFPAVTRLMVGHRLVVAMGALYLVGGAFGKNSNHFFRYNIASNDWTRLANMSVARGYSATVHHGDHIYVIGGCPWSKRHVTAEHYNLNTDQWETLPQLPKYCRPTLSAVVYNDRILVLGEESNDLSHLMLFHPETKQWEVLLSEKIPSRIMLTLPPVLVVHEQHCYRVTFDKGTPSKQLIRVTTNNGVTEATVEPLIHNVPEQENLTKNNASYSSIFCIDDSKYIRLTRRDCTFKLQSENRIHRSEHG